MIVFHVVLLVALVFLLANAVVNAVLIPTVRRPAKGRGGDSPRVSVLVPARNEERNIGRCLESLKAQDYPDVEVVVLDDRSEDRTGEIIAGLGFEEGGTGRCRVVRGAELPSGWAGKNWACHQLSEEATGEYLLFTDADTEHEEWSVSAAVALSEEHRAGLVSVWPEQETRTWSEKWVLPLIYVLGTGFMAHVVPWMALWSERFAKAVPGRVLGHFGAANGQFLCFTRAGYALVGGHEALKDDLVEDVRFGREMLGKAAEGGRLVNADGRRALRCRMYRNFGEVWDGFSKNMWPVFAGKTAQFWLAGVAIFMLMVFPFLALPFADGVVGKLVWAEVGVIVLFRLVIALRYGTSLWGVIFHVPSVLLGLAIGMNSARLARKGGLLWKGRTYGMTGGESGG